MNGTLASAERTAPAYTGIAGRHVLVTGASQGIGRAIAVAFAQRGARISAVARRRELLLELVEQVGGSAAGHGFASADLTAPGAPDAAVEECVRRAGAPDIIIHALGGSLRVQSLTSPLCDWQRVWQLNVGGGIALNNAVLPSMVERGWGRIVHVSSRSAVEYGGAGPYAAAKAYLNAYITIMGRGYAAANVLVNGIMPSAIAATGNSWWHAQQDKPETVRQHLAQHQTINRLGSPGDLMPFILLLASNDNTFAAGSVLSIDGGSK